MWCHAGVCVAASVFTIMTLSVDRYLAIKRPSTFRKYSAGNNAWKVNRLSIDRLIDLVDLVRKRCMHLL